MSTLSFQDYVRERMLRRRRAEQQAQEQAQAETAQAEARAAELQARPVPAGQQPAARARQRRPRRRCAHRAADAAAARARPAPRRAEPRDRRAAPAAAQADSAELLNELRSMKGLIEERFGALAFMEKLQRQPRQARLTQKLLDCGFSPALIRKLADGLPADVADEATWAASVLERNLLTGEARRARSRTSGGVYALIGATGVGKTTTTAKIAAAFADAPRRRATSA